MSIVSTIRTTSDTRLRGLVPTLVALGSSAIVATLTSPVFGLFTAVVTVSTTIVARALRKASLTMDGIFSEELDRPR